MSEYAFLPGDVLDIVIPDDWKPRKRAISRCKTLERLGVSRVLIIGSLQDDIYTAVACDLVSKGNSLPICISGKTYYVRIALRHIDAPILRPVENAILQDKEIVLKEIENRFAEKAELNRQRKARRKERRSNDPSMGDILRNWPTKAIAADRRKIEKERGKTERANIPQKQKTTVSTPLLRQRYINGYEIVPLGTLNQNAFKSRITMINYSCDECLICRTPLVRFINFARISKTEVARIPGKYCTHCDSFFDERGEAAKALVAQSSCTDDIILDDQFLFPHFAEKLRNAMAVKSSAMAVHLIHKPTCEHRLVSVVMNRTERNHELDVYHYSDRLAREILYSLYLNDQTVLFDEREYSIMKEFRLDWKNEPILRRVKIDTIVLRKGGGLYGGIAGSQNELIDVLLYSPFTKCFEVAHATYDSEYDLYYMDAKVFRNFVEKYGNPGIKLAAYQRGCVDFSTMREESILHAYGYVVGHSGLSDAARQKLLAEVLDLELMSANGILALLELNISMHSAEKYAVARADWETDRQFVIDYKVNPDRFIIANIGLK